jgi:hypothetical protein
MPDRNEKDKAAFAKFCGKLKANSSTVKRVHLPPSCQGLRDLDEWALQISNALFNSTVVSEVWIHVGHALLQDDLNSFLPYLRTNQALRILRLQLESGTLIENDPCKQIIRAIADNTNVDEVHLYGKVPIESILQCLETTLHATGIISNRADSQE